MSSSGVLPIKIEPASKKWHSLLHGKEHALGESSWISDCFTAHVLDSERFQLSRSPSTIFLFHFPSAHQIRTQFGNVTRRKRERKEKDKKNQLPVFQLQTLLDRFVKLAIKVLQWKVSNFNWFCVQNQQVCANTTGSRLTGGKSLQDPVRVTEISALCVCQWKKSRTCFTKIRVFYSKMKTRNQRVRISPLVSHPVCDLIKGYSWPQAS